MMNEGNDDGFADNPFRSDNNDVFYDANNNNNQQQQSNDPFAPQPVANQFQPQPTGQMQPMQNNMPMNNNQQFVQQPSMQQNQQPAGLMQQPVQQQPASGLMSPQNPNVPPPQQPTSMWGNLLMCLSMDSYKPYFDMDADDIVARVRGVFLHFYKPEYYRNNVVGVAKSDTTKGPDLYGPFWIAMTMIFILGVTANFHAYVHHTTVVHKNSAGSSGSGNSTYVPATPTAEQEFDYDITHLLNAAYICCGFVFLLPTILWMTTTCCMGMKALTLAEWVCLYGYSLVPYIPVAVLCIIPFGLVSWILLAAATAASCLLVVRNVSHPLLASDAGQAKAPPIILVILGTHIVFFLFLKVSFYHHVEK